MSETTPPPIPQDPERRTTGTPPPLPSGHEDRVPYNIFAEKIGGVPNIKFKDNLYQALAVAVFLIVGAAVGFAMGGWPGGILLGALVGLTAGILTSGAVLMVIGLCRKP